MLTEVLIAVAAVIVVFVILVALRPSEFRVTRSAAIAVPPEAVFVQVNDFHNWEAWSPWAKLDPAAKYTYEGPPGGVGAAFAWSGNKKVGAGHMTITESHPNDRVRIKLDFLRPFKATNTAEFAFKPNGNQTVVTWTMLGQNNFMSKAMQLFINCEKMVGRDFEKGLAQMKSVAEVTVRK